MFDLDPMEYVSAIRPSGRELCFVTDRQNLLGKHYYLCHFANGTSLWLTRDKLTKLPPNLERRMPPENWRTKDTLHV